MFFCRYYPTFMKPFDCPVLLDLDVALHCAERTLSMDDYCTAVDLVDYKTGVIVLHMTRGS